MQRSSVDFPDPERPKTTITSPLCRSRSTSRSTSCRPYTLRSPRTRTMTSDPARGSATEPSSGSSRTEPAARRLGLRRLPDVARGEPRLEPLLEEGEQGGERPVDRRHEDVRLEVLEVRLADELGAPEHLGGRHRRAEE